MKSLAVDTTYDEDVDAGYIYFDSIAPGEAVRQVVVAAEGLPTLSVILDLDSDNKLLGIELLGVKKFVARARIVD